MREKYEAIQRMQDYVETHLEVPISLADLSEEAGYSPCHASRLFKELVGMSPLEYVRARRLSAAAMRLRQSPGTILEISLETTFDSHEGFTRAFKKRFGITPEAYRRDLPAIPLFFPRSARAYYLHYLKGANPVMEPNKNTIFVQVVEKPVRKLILKRGVTATHYFEYCEEVGCDVWGILSSISEAIHEPLGMWLPERLRPRGTSEYAQGVEVGLSYARAVPAGMEMIELPPCRMMVFQTPPYRDEEMGQVIGGLQKAMEAYQPAIYGYEWADDDAPWYQLVPLPERGYIEGRPVRKRPV
jgi:AraC-like DNA-binding protein